MKISGLLNQAIAPAIDFEINSLSLDSRQIGADDVFIAMPGLNQHGLSYAETALAKGAKAIIYDPDNLPHPVADGADNYIAVPGLNKNLGDLAARFYGFPSQELTVIGVTGTNGKTSCSQFIAQALPNCGVIGTLGWGEPGKLTPTQNTTPDILSIHKMLRQFVEQQKSAVTMEVSSHGLHQGRVDGIVFKGAVFTNLSRDHLDYHGDMEAYLQAKLSLFTKPELQFAVINLDDAGAAAILAGLSEQVTPWVFSMAGRTLENAECITANRIVYGLNGITFEVTWRNQTVQAITPIVGKFNLQNLLAVLGVLLAMDMPLADAVAKLSTLKPIVGRMEQFGGDGQPTVFVDYAHTPDALEKVLLNLKGDGRLVVVFGCGGNRDKGKRPQMGKIAQSLADQVFITDDNPRDEASQDIINDILSGCDGANVTVIGDRTRAINTAIHGAGSLDCVLVAGKGHEDYQEINGVKTRYSDQEVIKQSLASWGRKP